MSSLSARVLQSIHEVPPGEWDALTGNNNPFVEHAFLALLEDSGSVGPRTAWQPAHLALYDGPLLVAASPFYRRGDSYGEYIFDWGWAQAAQRAGLRYYPKYTSAIPFTPATGPRMLVAPGRPRGPLQNALAGLALEVARKAGGSGVHWLFVEEEEQQSLGTAGYHARASFQFHWRNRGWKDFDAFLADFTRKRRHEVQRERRKVREAGLEVRVLRGTEMEEEDWAMVRHFYRSTTEKMGAIPYLKDRFFQLLPERFAHRTVTVIARHGTRRVAGTLNFSKGNHLYGRYWGCLEEFPALHFECCYYALIEWGLANGIELFEAGAQGEHKISRGFLPALTRSAHRLFHPGLEQAVAQFLTDEAAHVKEVIANYGAESPFKQAT